MVILEILAGFYLVISIAITVCYIEEENWYNYSPTFKETIKFLLLWPYYVVKAKTGKKL
jgi:hypothetical protein